MLHQPVTSTNTVCGRNGRVQFAVSAMQGYRPSMEDAHTAIEELEVPPATSFFAVYDGHGGPAVAQFCASHFHAEVSSHPGYATDLDRAVERSFFRMDELLREKKSRLELAACTGKNYYEPTDQKRSFLNCFSVKRHYRGPIDEGSTACVALIRDNLIVVGNAGDSRCVLSRNGVAIDLSTDHKPDNPNELQRIVAAGSTVRLSRGAPRIDDGISVSRAIGDEMYKNNQELPPEGQALTCAPQIVSENITPDTEFLVIACDGIWSVMSSQAVVDFVAVRIIAPEANLGSICEALLMMCLELGSTDNMTVVLVRFVHPRVNPDSASAEPSDKSKKDDDRIVEEDVGRGKNKSKTKSKTEAGGSRTPSLAPGKSTGC